jgi:hypothetical protein
MNPYQSPRCDFEFKPPRLRIRRHLIAALMTVGPIFVVSLLFTTLVMVPADEKPRFFLEMLSGPYGALLANGRFKFDLISSSIITLLLLLYPAFPSCLTACGSAIGGFCWIGCGIVNATGGV